MATYKQFTGAAPVAHLTGAISGSPTTFVVDNATGFPTGAGGVPFVVDIDRGTASEEKVLCSLLSGNTFTIQNRGFDGTAQTTHAIGATVEHVIDADSMNDGQQHIHVSSRDDHLQYPNLNGARNFTGLQHFGNGLTVDSGDITVSAGNVTVSNGNVTTANGGAVTSAGTVQANAGINLAASPLTGFRIMGATTTGGPPSSGTWVLGDVVLDRKFNMFWECTAGGSPGTWGIVSPASIAKASVYLNSAATLGTTDTIIPFDTTEYDPDSSLTTGVGAKYTVPVAGLYTVDGTVTVASNSVSVIRVYKNGATARQPWNNSGTTSLSVGFSVSLECAANDTIQVAARASVAATSLTTGSTNTYFAARLIGS